ncbi:hypothetical protein [Streptomyces sp. NPDC057966]|uniref:hypothetical protein n=1 Tax=Streptomyces sp. NPDC057966 TaxID=3346292 RepID=UPI0036EBFA28
MRRAKDQLALLWQAFTGDKAPTTYRAMVDAAGSVRRAAQLAKCSPTTIRRRLKREADSVATISTVKAQITAVGGVRAAAAAAGVSERTIRTWRQQEREGQQHGTRQQKRMDKLQHAARKAQTAAAPAPKDDVRARLRQGILQDAQARQQSINPRRAARISSSGARMQYTAQVTVISTDQMTDTRERTQDLEVNGDVMQGGMQAWLDGGSDKTVLGKLSEGFTNGYLHSNTGAYASGAKWQFDSFSQLSIRQTSPGSMKWGD